TNGLGQTISATATTTTGGAYSFSTDSSGNALLPGTYKITETAPTGYQTTATKVGTVNGATDGTVLSATQIGSIVLTSGQGGISYNFGHTQPVTLAGTVFQDTNASGVMD